ncbi:unnamed protein product [Ectocarpus sp. 4 AP-2014]
MGNVSSRSPAMVYKDGNIWNSTFDEVGNSCWVNGATGEIAYHFIGGKAARGPSSAASSPHTMQSPGRVSRRPSDTTSPYAMHSPGHAAPWTGGAPAMLSPGGYVAPPMHHSPSPTVFAAHAVHSSAPVGLAGPATNHPVPGQAAATMVPYSYYHQPGYGGVVAAGDPTPTAAGEAVGYRSSKHYVRPRSKASWMWTQP